MYRIWRALIPLLLLAAACSPDRPGPASETPGIPPTLAPRPASRTPLPPAATKTASVTPSPFPSPTRTSSPTIDPFQPTDCPTRTPTPTLTLTPEVSPSPTATATNTATATPTDAATATVTPGPSPSPTLTITPGPSLTPTTTPTATLTATASPTITPTPHPCPSPTPSLTPTSTPTPVLPSLASLLVSTADLNSLTSGIWQDPPEDLTGELVKDGEQCLVDCAGLRWQRAGGGSQLTLLIYRTPDFPQSVASAIGTRGFYEERGFMEVDLPPIEGLPPFTWASVLGSKDVVIITAQGPAVLVFFWQNDTALDTGPLVETLARYLALQASVLLENDFITNPS